MPSSCETLGVEPGCVLTDRLERERDEAQEDARAARRERDEAIRTREEQDTEAQHRAEQYCREKREAERERDEALEECRQCRADIWRLVEVRDEALAEVERLKGEVAEVRRDARERVALLVAAMDRTRFGAEPPAVSGTRQSAHARSRTPRHSTGPSSTAARSARQSASGTTPSPFVPPQTNSYARPSRRGDWSATRWCANATMLMRLVQSTK